MALYQKVDGVWVQCQRPYVKRNGVWTACTEAWVRRSGVWVQAYNYDVTPPDPPEITTQIIEDWQGDQLKTRFIRVGARLPGSSNDPDVRLIRVLTTYAGKPPTDPGGGTYTSQPDRDWPAEPWSEWRYNDYGKHADSSILNYKQWPLNYGDGQTLPGDKDYYFGAWSLDSSGNWSVATQASIHIPKDSVDAPRVMHKEVRMQANNSGSYRVGSGGFASGDLVQQNSPKSTGLWFHGEQFTDNVGAQGPPTIRAAQVFVRRADDDGGVANANVYLYWHGYPTVATMPPAGAGVTKHEITKVGTLAKGQGAWFDLPATFYGDLDKNVKGLGLDYKDPVKAEAQPNDFSEVVGVGAALRCGEVHLVWDEQL